MPYSIDRKNKCVYKKKSDGSRGKKVGCTKGNLDDYIAALHIHADESKMMNENHIPGSIDTLYAVQRPYDGCEPKSLVKHINPLMGLGSDSQDGADSIHAVYSDEDLANDVAMDLYEDYLKGQQALEEKKDTITDKLKKAIDKLEKKRKEHMDMAKEDPKNASQHREHIAQLMDKIDDFMTKLEKIEKSKKTIEKETDKKEK